MPVDIRPDLVSGRSEPQTELMMDTPHPRSVAEVVKEMHVRLADQPPELAHLRPFLSTYLRTTEAVGQAVRSGMFIDGQWVERWDVAFADYYLAAYDTFVAGRVQEVPRPWRLAFEVPAALPNLRHILLGINAHVNFDLPQAMLDVISEGDFRDPEVIGRRRRDHATIDTVLASRISAEDAAIGDRRTFVDVLLNPLNRLGSRRFLREAREKVWLNVEALQAARLLSAEAYRVRLAELNVLASAKIVSLLAPGQVLLRLAATGFGVVLPPADPQR